MDLPGLMFINEECGNLILVLDGGEVTRNNDRKRKSLTNAINEIEVSMVFLVVTLFVGR